MKHRVFIYIIALAATLRAEAQTSIEEVLRSVEANNKELQATRQQVEAQTRERISINRAKRCASKSCCRPKRFASI